MTSRYVLYGWQITGRKEIQVCSTRQLLVTIVSDIETMGWGGWQLKARSELV